MKKLSKIFILTIVLFLPLTARAKVDMVAFKSHEAPKKPYQAILIQNDKKSLKAKVELEKAALKAFSKLSSSHFIAETQILAPVREYSSQERAEILEKNQIQAILKICIKKFNAEKRSTTIPEYTYDEEAKPGESKIKTSKENGKTIEYTMFFKKYQIELIDLETNQAVWMAEVGASHDVFTKKWTYRSMMKKAAKKLLEANLIANR